MERGVAEGRRLPGQRPHAPVPRQHLRNHCPPHRHPSAAASERVLRPVPVPAAPGQTPALSAAFSAHERQGGMGEKSGRKRRKNDGRARRATGKPYAPSAPSASPSISPFNSGPQSQAPGPGRQAEVAQPGVPEATVVGARTPEQGNGRVGWAWLAGGRAPNKAARLPLPGARAAGGAPRVPAPPQPGAALAPGTLAGPGAAASPLPAREQRPFGTMGPLPRPGEGRYKGWEARPGPEPGVRKVKAEEGEGPGEDGGGRGSPGPLPSRPSRCPQPHRGGGAGARASSLSRPAERAGVCTQRRAGPPASPPAPGAATARRARAPDGPGVCPAAAPPGPGARGAPLSSTHPQLRAPAHGGTRGPSSRLAALLSECPSALPSGCPASHWRARGSAAQPRKVPPPPSSPVSEKDATGEAAAPPPPPPRPRLPEPGGRGPGLGGGGTRRGEGAGRDAPWDRGGPRAPGRARQGLLAPGPRAAALSHPAQALAFRLSGLGLSHRRGHLNRGHLEGKGETEKTPTALLCPEPP